MTIGVWEQELENRLRCRRGREAARQMSKLQVTASVQQCLVHHLHSLPYFPTELF